MRARGLLITAVILAGLSGLVYWSNQYQKRKKEEPDKDAPPKIINIPQDSIVRIEIRRRGQEQPVAIEKGQDGQWRIVSPENLPADQDTVRSLLSTASELTANRLLEEQATDLRTYGLDPPAVEVTIRQNNGKALKLLLGDETPTGSYYYAKLQGDPRVFTLASWNKTSLDKSAWDLRDKRLLTFDSNKLTRIELVRKGQTIEIGKNAQNEWQILKPQPMRADGGNVETLISRLQDAKMDTTEPTAEQAKKAQAAFAKAERVAIVRVTDAAGTQELEVRKTKEGDYYARSSVVAGIWKITNWVGEGVDKGLDDLRNKKLFDFGWNEPTRIEIRDGDQRWTFEKKGEDWVSAGKVMDAVSVRSLIDKLRDLQAKSFPEKGFTQPVLEARVVWDDGKRQDKVLIAQAGERFIGKREGEPALYELTSDDIRDLRQAVKDVKPKQVASRTGQQKGD